MFAVGVVVVVFVRAAFGEETAERRPLQTQDLFVDIGVSRRLEGLVVAQAEVIQDGGIEAVDDPAQIASKVSALDLRGEEHR